MTIKNANVIVSPQDQSPQLQYVSAINLVLMSMSLVCFGVVFFGAINLIWLYMFSNEPQNPPGVIFPQIISLSLLFSMGWLISLISVQVLNNEIYPFLLRGLSFCVSFGMVGIYLVAMLKTFTETGMGIGKYALVLFAGYLVLVAFYLLTEIADLRLMIIPLGAILGLHVFSMVFHYIFYSLDDLNFFGIDIGLMVILFALIMLMVRRELYIPLQQAIKAVLITNTPKSLPIPRSKNLL